MVRVAGTGDVERKKRSYLGDLSNRLEVGRWSRGRPVFRKIDQENERFLSVKAEHHVWTVSQTVSEDFGWIKSGKATNSPATQSEKGQHSQLHAKTPSTTFGGPVRLPALKI